MYNKFFNLIYLLGLIFSWLLFILTIYGILMYKLELSFEFLLMLFMPALALLMAYKHIKFIKNDEQ